MKCLLQSRTAPRLIVAGGGVAVGLLGAMALAQDEAPPFAGWPTMRVVEQEGYPNRMLASDLDGDGHDELILINTRNARLDLYSWKGDQPSDGDDRQAGAGNVNDLPMAPEVSVTEVPLNQLPIDVRAFEPRGDEPGALYVLVSDPNRLLRLTAKAGDDDQTMRWSVDRKWELLAGRYAGGGDLMQWLPGSSVGDDDAPSRPDRLLISCNEGIQVVELPTPGASTPNQRATWMEPRETINRYAWWLADLDGDGRDDLVEWTGESNQTIRWYRASDAGLLPAQTLHDRPVAIVDMLWQPDTADELLVLESSPTGVVRRYRLSEGDADDLGKADPLALPGGDGAEWTLAQLEGQTALLVLDPNQPRIVRFNFTDRGWEPGDSYPSIAGTSAVVAPAAMPGTLLLRPEDNADLYQTTWADGRLSYPQPMRLGGDDATRTVVGLGQVGQTAWCVYSHEKDLVLTRWEPGFEKPFVTSFPDAAGKADQALWLGENRLLVLDKFARGLRVVTLDAEGVAHSSEPAHLAKAKLDEFRLFDDGQSLRLGRFTDGVLQWLDDNLDAQDQVMLPDGLRLADLTLADDGKAYALQQGGGAIHRLAPDVAGVLRVEATTRVDGGRSLRWSPHVGLLMTTPTGLTRLAPGKPQTLAVVQSIDARAGRPTGVRDATVHRIGVDDFNADGRADAVLCDDRRHQVTVLASSGPDADLKPLISWPVFEDQTYPYGGGEDQLVREPRNLAVLELDGDGKPDLALLCHDRLLLYLSATHDDAPDTAPTN